VPEISLRVVGIGVPVRALARTSRSDLAASRGPQATLAWNWWRWADSPAPRRRSPANRRR